MAASKPLYGDQVMKAPTYDYYVQTKDRSQLPKHTAVFLKTHAIVPLSDVAVEKINDFLDRSWQRARLAGTGMSPDVLPPEDMAA